MYIPLKHKRILDIYVKSPQEMSIIQYAERVRNPREDSDLNHTTVARAINVAQTTYSDYEKGKVCIFRPHWSRADFAKYAKVRIPLECLIELAKFYNVDMNYIAGVSNIKNVFSKKAVAFDLPQLFLTGKFQYLTTFEQILSILSNLVFFK